MKHRIRAYLAAAWAVAFAAPHVYWATGRTEGLGTALSNRVVDKAGFAMALDCALIAAFCLCGAAVAVATVQAPIVLPVRVERVARRVLTGLVWFGAVLLIARSLDIFVEFSLGLTGVLSIPADQRDNYLYLARWFMFFWLPWFALGAIAWTRLALSYSRRPVRATAVAWAARLTPPVP